jgi:hypothetical protein
VLQEDDRKVGTKTDLHDMDPYYVHYLLVTFSLLRQFKALRSRRMKKESMAS